MRASTANEMSKSGGGKNGEKMDTITKTEQRSQLDLFGQRLPNRPYCSDDLNYGIRPAGKARAVKKRYIQHNPPALVNALVFDLDRPVGLFDFECLPAPTLLTINNENGHAHAVYMLDKPVCRSDAAKLAPLRYLAAIERAYSVCLSADEGYTGLITKNPLNSDWSVFEYNDTFSLDYLAEFVQLQAKPKKREIFGLGRNCSLFDSVRNFAYREIRKRDKWELSTFQAVVLFKAEALNTFNDPLPYSEVKAIAKSVARWTHRNMDKASFEQFVKDTHTSEIQSKRARSAGLAKRGKTRYNQSDVADIFKGLE